MCCHLSAVLSAVASSVRFASAAKVRLRRIHLPQSAMEQPSNRIGNRVLDAEVTAPNQNIVTVTLVCRFQILQSLVRVQKEAPPRVAPPEVSSRRIPGEATNSPAGPR